jgi:acyl carrier protein
MNEKIRSILEEIRPEIETFPSSENFILDGILDSFDIIILVSELEKNFQVTIDGEEVTLENFKNVSSISSLISQYLKK